MDADEAISVLSDFLRLNLSKVGRRVNSVANPIAEINQRHRSANPGKIDLIPDDVVARRITRDEARVLKFIQHTSRWVPANPSNEETIKKINSTYVGIMPTASNENTFGTMPNIANILTERGFAFDDAIGEAKYILLSGVRGVGKTAFMNFWLTQNTRRLETENTTWFRIDATKVYAIWQNNKGQDVKSLFERYYLVHALYVLLRYSGSLHNIPGSPFTPVSTSEFFASIVQELQRSQPDVTDRLKSVYRRAKLQAPVRPDESVDIVSRVLAINTKAVKELFAEAQSLLAKSFEDKNITTIAIVDGIDNIAWTKRNTFYQKTCANFSVITEALLRTFGPRSHMLLAARPETIHEVRHISSDDTSPSGFNWQYNHDQLQEWRIIPPSAKEVLTKKLTAASDESVFSEERLEAATDDRERKFLTQILVEIKRDTHFYPEAIERNTRDALKQSLKGRVRPSIQAIERNLSQENLLKFVFDNDLRAYLDNVIKVFFIRRSLLQRTDLPLAEFQRRIMQFVLLNGRPFFNSREQYIALEGKRSRANYKDRGMVFPNIFWWPSETTSNSLDNWHGLAALRLLQLAECKGSFTCCDLLYCAKQIFGYDINVMIEIMESLVAFGLIDIHTDTAATEFNQHRLASMKLHDYNNRGYVTEKGKVYPALIFSRPDLLYFYALDTPQKFDLVVEDTRMVKSFFEFSSGTVEDQFFAAAIPTVATFLLHIFHYSSAECTKVRSKNVMANAEKKRCLKYFGGRDTVLNAIALPQNLKSTFLDWARRGMVPSPLRTQKDANDIIENVIGVFGGYTRK
ncbi:MAG: P-loop NTPase fold protein [Cyanobacteria bacterium P01_F01_bin.53]